MRRIGTPFSLRELLQQRLALFRPRLEIAVNVLHQNHRAVDDDAEINRSDRKQIRVLIAHHQNDDAEKQRERNIRADNDGAAQIAEKQPLDEEDQETPENQIVQNG